MAQNDTLIIRAALEGNAAIHCDIEIEVSQSLYALARAIVTASISILTTPSASTAA